MKTAAQSARRKPGLRAAQEDVLHQVHLAVTAWAELPPLGTYSGARSTHIDRTSSLAACTEQQLRLASAPRPRSLCSIPLGAQGMAPS